MQSGRELAFEEGGTFVVSEQGCVGRCQLCMWAPTVAFSLKRRRQPLQGQRLSQRRCWGCLWGVPRFLCGKCHLIWRRKKMSPSWFSVVAVFPWFSAVEMVPVVPVVGISLRFWFGLVNLVKTWITRFALVNLVMSSFNTARCSTLDRRLVRQQRIWMFEN